MFYIKLAFGIYLLIGLIMVTASWKGFRASIEGEEGDPNLKYPPPWACWLFIVFGWPFAFIPVSSEQQDRVR